MNVIEVMKMSAAYSGHAPAGVTYKPRDDMRIAIPLVEELIDAAEAAIGACEREDAVLANFGEFERLRSALAAVQS